MDDRHLAEEVVKEFDPAHRLSELSASWTSLMAGAASFDKMLQVNIYVFISSFLVWFFSFPLLLFILFSSSSI